MACMGSGRKNIKRKKKGNNKILIDEGYLISSIRYQISTKNGTNIFISEFKSI